MQVAAIVPSLNPDPLFPDVVAGLVQAGFARILVVNDGSGPEYDPLFEQVATQPGCVVLRHTQNRGKGRALKTAFAHYLEDTGDCVGVITVDADGQHRIEDVLACARALEQTPDSLVLGVRDFEHDGVPQRSAVGNKLTRNVIRALFRLDITDTQTGLRGIPNAFVRQLVDVRGERYEFETLMLLETKRAGVPIVERPIHTIYIDENASSHFRPVVDSVRIYKLILGFGVVYAFFRLLQLIKFALASLLSFVVDIALFALLNHLLADLPAETRFLVATVGARVCSSLFNFFLNKVVVFQSRAGTGNSMLRYFLLAAVQVCCSYGGVYLLDKVLPLPAEATKVIVDCILFFISYFIQRKWVFPKATQAETPQGKQ